MHERPDIPFPVMLSPIGREVTLAGLSTIELGALIRIAQVSWTQEPPASVPDTDERLARWAGLSTEQWRSVRPAILEIFTPADDGRLHNTALAQAYHELAAKQARRSAAGRKAATIRHGGVEPPGPLRLTSESHANRMRTASGSHGDRPVPPTPPSSKRSAPLRSPPSDPNPSAQSGPSARNADLDRVGAGARAQEPKADRRDEQPADADAARRDVETLRRLNDQQEVRQILGSALFEFATEDRRTIPPNVIESLATSEHARPQLALYAVQRVSEACRKAKAAGESCNTIGMLIAAFGAQRHGRGRPWEVPTLFIETEWAARKARRSAAENLQAHIHTLRHRAGVESRRGAV